MYAVYSSSLIRDMHLYFLPKHHLRRFNAESLPLGTAIREDLVVTQLYNPVLSYIQTRSLQIKENQRASKFQSHSLITHFVVCFEQIAGRTEGAMRNIVTE